MTARWITRWKPAVGFESSAPSVIRFSSSDSRYAVRLRRSLSRSTLQARITAEASESSISARSRCSSVAYSWCRSLASASARCSDCSRLRENVGIQFFQFICIERFRISLLFHHALQRMLMFACKVHHLCHLGLCNFIRIDATFADPVVVDMQHNSCGGFVILAKESLQHVHDEFHRRVVIIENKHAVQVRPLGLRLGLCNARGAGPARFILALAVVIRHPRRYAAHQS